MEYADMIFSYIDIYKDNDKNGDFKGKGVGKWNAFICNLRLPICNSKKKKTTETQPPARRGLRPGGSTQRKEFS